MIDSYVSCHFCIANTRSQTLTLLMHFSVTSSMVNTFTLTQPLPQPSQLETVSPRHTHQPRQPVRRVVGGCRSTGLGPALRGLLCCCCIYYGADHAVCQVILHDSVMVIVLQGSYGLCYAENVGTEYRNRTTLTATTTRTPWLSQMAMCV